MATFEYLPIRNNTAYAITCVESSDDEIIVVPSEYKGKPVKKLDNFFFTYLNAYEIRLPESIDEFGTGIFDGANISFTYEYEGGYYIGNLKNPYMVLIGIYEIPEDGKFVIHKDTKCIEDDVFRNRSDLVEIDIPDGVVAIGNSVFSDCKNLERVKLPDKIRFINYGTFMGCDKLSSINIPNSVEFICDSAFRGCSSLTGELKLSDNVKCIGWKSFEGNSFNKITLGEGIIKIDRISFHNVITDNSHFYNFYEDAYYLGTKSNPYKYLMKFDIDASEDPPEEMEYKIHPRTKVIANRASEYMTWIDSSFTLDLRNSVEYIGDAAFQNKSNLRKLILGDQIKVIGSECFASTGINEVRFPEKGEFNAYQYSLSFGFDSGIEELEIPKTLKLKEDEIYEYEYNNQNSSKILDNNVYYIPGKGLFVGIAPLKKVKFTNEWDEIPEEMFENCGELKEITFPKNLKDIGDSAFYGCGFESIEIPGSVSIIGESVFDGCENLSEIYINEGVEVLEDYAFCRYDNNPITKISIPNSIKHIGIYSLPNYDQLENVEGGTTIVDNGVLYVGNESNPHLIAYYLQDRDDVLKIADGTKFIYSDFCEGQGEFVDVILPESLEFLGDNALDGIAISSQTITIPKRVRRIGERSLSIQGLKHVVMLPETPPLVYDNNSLPMDCTVDIINGNSGTYESAMGWSGYGDGVLIERSTTWLNFYNYTLALKRH